MTSPTFADIAVALRIQASELALRTEEAEHVANAIGLFPETVAGLVGERRRQAELVAMAHLIIKELIPVEACVRAIISDLRRADLKLVGER